jgi:hypothetical protein
MRRQKYAGGAATLFLFFAIIGPSLPLNGQVSASGAPLGPKFSDGWTLKWGETMEALAAHFPSLTLSENYAQGLDNLKRMASGDYSQPAHYSTFDSGSGHWQEHPGYPPIKRDDMASCQAPDIAGFSVCSFIGSAAVPRPFDHMVLRFKDDRLCQVDMGLDSSSVPSVEESLLRRLGNPESRRVGTVQNGFGATFDQTETTWNSAEVQIRLTLHYERVDRGLLHMEGSRHTTCGRRKYISFICLSRKSGHSSDVTSKCHRLHARVPAQG